MTTEDELAAAPVKTIEARATSSNGTVYVVEIKCRWWLKWYFQALILFCQTFGTKPNWDMVMGFVVKHGLVIEYYLEHDQEN